MSDRSWGVWCTGTVGATGLDKQGHWFTLGMPEVEARAEATQLNAEVHYEARPRDGAVDALAPVVRQDDEPVEDFGKRLVAAGYKSTSNRYRSIGRVDPGRTALEVLRDVSPSSFARVMEMARRWAESDLLRVHSRNQLTLSPEEYKAFRAAGGESAGG